MAILCVDGLVILSALFAFDTDSVLVSLICLYVIGRVVDRIQVGLVRSKNILIVSDKHEEIKELLLKQLDKGITVIPIEGGYRQQENRLLMTVVREKEFYDVKEGILAIDEAAFFVTIDASEVYGRGFSLKKAADDYGVEINQL